MHNTETKTFWTVYLQLDFMFDNRYFDIQLLEQE